MAQVVDAWRRMAAAGNPVQSCTQLFEGGMNGAVRQMLAGVRDEERIDDLAAEFAFPRFSITG